jgi:hypothetical protein
MNDDLYFRIQTLENDLADEKTLRADLQQEVDNLKASYTETLEDFAKMVEIIERFHLNDSM